MPDAEQYGDDEEGQRNERHRARDGGDDQQEQQRERRIHGQLAAERDQEAAHGFVAAQLAGQAADAGGHLVEPDREEAQVDRACKALVDRVRDAVVDPRAQLLGRVFQGDGQQYPERQYQQGLHGARGDDAVVDLHGVEGDQDAEEGQEQAAGSALDQLGLVGLQLVDHQAEHRAVRRAVGRGEAQGGDGVAGKAVVLPFLPALGGRIEPFGDPEAVGVAGAQYSPAAVRRGDERGQVRRIGPVAPACRGQLQAPGRLREPLPRGVLRRRCRHGLLQGQPVDGFALQRGEPQQRRHQGVGWPPGIDRADHCRPLPSCTCPPASMSASTPRLSSASRQFAS